MALKDIWKDKIDGISDIIAEDINGIAHAVIQLENESGGAGESGATFYPSVSAEGVISWTNDKGLPNPTPVNIKGEKGEPYTLTENDLSTIIDAVLEVYPNGDEVSY